MNTNATLYLTFCNKQLIIKGRIYRNSLQNFYLSLVCNRWILRAIISLQEWKPFSAAVRLWHSRKCWHTQKKWTVIVKDLRGLHSHEHYKVSLEGRERMHIGKWRGNRKELTVQKGSDSPWSCTERAHYTFLIRCCWCC